MSKKEKRLERQVLKQEIELKKKARLLNKLELPKTPYIVTAPSPCKIPKTIEPGSIGDCIMMWSRDIVDKEGTWSWGVARDWGKEVGERLIGPLLRECEKKTWNEIWSET